MTAIALSQETPLDEAMPGMVLAEAVLDKAGARLISPGVELTEKSIHALRQRGIYSIRILLPLTDAAYEAHSQARERKLQRLDRLFKNSVDAEPNRLLLASLQRYRRML
jgi:hypothetical protein